MDYEPDGNLTLITQNLIDTIVEHPGVNKDASSRC